MTFVTKIATPSGDKVLAKSKGNSVRFTAFAFNQGYVAARLKAEILRIAAYLKAEAAAVSVETDLRITVSKVL